MKCESLSHVFSCSQETLLYNVPIGHNQGGTGMEKTPRVRKKKDKRLDPLAVALGARVKRLRESAGMKQQVLALSAGYAGHSSIAKIESGESMPSAPQCVALARALSVPVEEITGASDHPLEETLAGQDALKRGEWVAILRRLADEIEASTERGSSGEATMHREGS